MELDCLVIGDLNVDLIINEMKGLPEIGKETLSDNYLVTIGGSGGILANVLSKLGLKTAIISKISNDHFGKYLISSSKKNNLDTSLITVKENKNTGLTVSLSYESGKSQISCLELLKSISYDEINVERINSLKHLHFSSYFMMSNIKNDYLNLIEKVRKKFNNLTISFDTNDDPEQNWDRKLLEIFGMVDIIFLNEREAIKISRKDSLKEALEDLSKITAKILIKMGKKGYMANIDGQFYEGNCKNISNKNFKDGTGAGDNYDAGFIYGFLNGLSYQKCLEFANYCGEKSIEYVGGVGDDLKFDDLKEHYKKLIKK